MENLDLKNKRILIAVAWFHPIIGGMETQTKKLAAYLKELGFEVCVITKQVSPKLPSSDLVDGIKVIRVEKNILGFIVGVIKLTNKYDVLLFAGQLSNSSKLRFNLMLLLGLIARILGKKVVFWPSSGVERYLFLFEGSLNPAKLLIRAVNKIVCISSEQEAFFGQMLVTKPTVIIQTPWTYPREGGIQTMSMNVAKKLTSLGVHVVLLAKKHDSQLKSHELNDGVEIVRTSSNFFISQVQTLFCLGKNLKNLKSYSLWGHFEGTVTPAQYVAMGLLSLLGKKFYIRCCDQL